MKVKITFLLLMGFIFTTKAQTLLYSNDFEAGVNDAVITGNGVIEDSGNSFFGKVFHNSATGQAIRSNYLNLPATVFADLQTAASNELTISFWVNKGTAVDYFYSPIFSAYGAAPDAATGNTWPMMVLQSRGLAQVNNAGWCDFTDAQNVSGTNVASTEWLDDNNWHFYTAVFTSTNAKIYIDGVIMNEWNISGTGDGNVISGLFTSGSALTYICLGGNQAWSWADPDAAYLFDKVRIHSSALTKEQIDNLIAEDMTSGTNEVEMGLYKINYNAVANVISIEGLDGSEKVELITILGQRINLNVSSTSIYTGNLNKDIYFVRITKGNNSKTQKILVR